MQRIIVSAVLFLLIGSSGCKKEKTNETIVKGHVENQLTGESLQGIPILVLECTDFFDNGISCGDSKTFFTDGNGNYFGSFTAVKGKTYRLNIGANPVIPGKEYSLNLVKNTENTFNFSQKPFKNVKVRLTVHRHDRNFLDVEINSHDYEDLFYKILYAGVNPSYDLDTTFYSKIIASRNYYLTAGLYNTVSTGGLSDPVVTDLFFSSTAADTTYVTLNIP